VSEQEEPYLLFRRAVEKATKDIGGNMEGFVLMYAVKRKNLPNPPESAEEGERLMYIGGGSGEANVNSAIHLNIAANMFEGFLAAYRGNLYIAAEIAKSRIIELIANRERLRRP
jgi:hypothetical protein